MRHDLSQ